MEFRSKYAEIAAGSSRGLDFFSSVAAGLLLGLGLDWLLVTSPWLVVIGTVAGFVSGFAKLWSHSRVLEEEARRRGRIA